MAPGMSLKPIGVSASLISNIHWAKIVKNRGEIPNHGHDSEMALSNKQRIPPSTR
jgi:hypothetical protein